MDIKITVEVTLDNATTDTASQVAQLLKGIATPGGAVMKLETDPKNLKLTDTSKDEAVAETPAPAKRSHKKKPEPAPIKEEEDDEEEAPAKKKKPAPVEEDDDEEEEAPAKKKKKPAVEEDDEEEEDDDEFDFDAIPKKKDMAGLRVLGGMLSKAGLDKVIDYTLDFHNYESLSEVKKDDFADVFDTLVKRAKKVTKQ